MVPVSSRNCSGSGPRPTGPRPNNRGWNPRRSEFPVSPDPVSLLPIFDRYVHALSTGDLEALGAVFADDVVWHQPGEHRLSGTRRGKAEVFDLLAAMAQHSDGSLRVEAESAMENGDLIAATVHFSASRGDARVEMTGVDLFRIEHDRIAEVWLFSSDQAAEDAFCDL